MKVVIPAAGRGSRFQPLNLGIPKELLELGSRPLIAHALQEAALGGFEEAIVVVSPQKQALVDWVASHPTPLPVSFVTQAEPLGLGAAVAVGARRLRAPYAVLLPDDVIADPRHWHTLRSVTEAGAAAITVREVKPADAERFGVAECESDRSGRLRVVRLREKPARGETSSNLAILGRYVVSGDVAMMLTSVPPGAIGEVQLTDAFAAAVEAGKDVFAVMFEGQLYDCGTPADYEQSRRRYRE